MTNYLENIYECNKCGKVFCSNHRLYEDHICTIFAKEIELNIKSGKLLHGDLHKYEEIERNNKLFKKICHRLIVVNVKQKINKTYNEKSRSKLSITNCKAKRLPIG